MANRLAAETSPYLLQHADNPVHWYPWGEEALALAREQDKPILLSIGYSACHWCHVMAHESFEDTATAAVMNELFINIKVDREERPDLDQIYQHAHSILSRRGGGWPLTMFLTPTQIPFYGGTYFPPDSRYGLPGFADLLRQLAHAWQHRRDEIETQNVSVLEALKQTLRQEGPAALDGAVINAAVTHLARLFDPVHGGFGGAPKFPNPSDLDLLLRGEPRNRQMALLTLEKMASGGIYDHVGGGFCRYSVDDHWEIPHFEKMLYDNGQLLSLYADAWLITRNARYAEVIEQTVAWAMREMRAEQGAFYSSLDADSEGEEGRFYVWRRAELQILLAPNEYAVLQQCFGLDRAANFERAWHLYRSGEDVQAARALNISPDELNARWATARAKLFAAREQRMHPGRDDKILTSWNALMVKGLARAGRVSARRDWILAAQQAVDYIRQSLWRNGRLLATCKDGKAHLNAYLDDHAYLLDALFELLQAEFRHSDLEFGIKLADVLLARFQDDANGGFFFTSHDHEQLIERPKPAFDNAAPAGNGVAARVLQRFGHLLGDARYLKAAERTLKAFARSMQQNPAACASLVMALEDYLVPPPLVLLCGPEKQVSAWKTRLDQYGLSGATVIALPEDMAALPQALQRPRENHVNAWVCRGVECLPAIDDINTLLEALRPLGKQA